MWQRQHTVLSLINVIFDTSSVGSLSFNSYVHSWQIFANKDFLPFSPSRSVPVPWKESTVGWIIPSGHELHFVPVEYTSGKAYPRGLPTFSLSILGQSVRLTSADMTEREMQSLISFKVMMNQFQRTFFLFYRKILIFESALIHRRTHPPVPNSRS